MAATLYLLSFHGANRDVLCEREIPDLLLRLADMDDEVGRPAQSFLLDLCDILARCHAGNNSELFRDLFHAF